MIESTMQPFYRVLHARVGLAVETSSRNELGFVRLVSMRGHSGVPHDSVADHDTSISTAPFAK